VAALFGVLYPIGILAGIAITPLVTLFILLGMVSLILPSGIVTETVYYVMEYIYRGIVWITKSAALLPGISAQRISVRIVILSASILFCAVIWITRGVRLKKFSKKLAIIHDDH
jgi:hypothetical protein